jgi:hypothetical protein
MVNSSRYLKCVVNRHIKGGGCDEDVSAPEVSLSTLAGLSELEAYEMLVSYNLAMREPCCECGAAMELAKSVGRGLEFHCTRRSPTVCWTRVPLTKFVRRQGGGAEAVYVFTINRGRNRRCGGGA